MYDDFQNAVAKVWDRLGLPAPRFAEASSIRMRIENVGIDLSDSGTGLLLIEGSAGRFSLDGQVRARQTRRILDTNLGLIVGHDAAVFAKTLPTGDATLAVRSVFAYRTGSIDRLVSKIEDVLRTIDYYAADLKTIDPVQTPRRAGATPELEAVMIFRP